MKVQRRKKMLFDLTVLLKPSFSKPTSKFVYIYIYYINTKYLFLHHIVYERCVAKPLLASPEAIAYLIEKCNRFTAIASLRYVSSFRIMLHLSTFPRSYFFSCHPLTSSIFLSTPCVWVCESVYACSSPCLLCTSVLLGCCHRFCRCRHTHTVLISFFCYAHEFRWIFHSVRSSSISISLSLSLALFQIKSKLNEVFCFCSNLASMSGQWAEHIFHLSIHILVHIAHTEIDTKRSHLMQMSSSTAEKWMSFINEREKMCLPYRNARVIMDILQLACSDRQYY